MDGGGVGLLDDQRGDGGLLLGADGGEVCRQERAVAVGAESVVGFEVGEDGFALGDVGFEELVDVLRVAGGPGGGDAG